jgi:hypothetical protein
MKKGIVFELYWRGSPDKITLLIGGENEPT